MVAFFDVITIGSLTIGRFLEHVLEWSEHILLQAGI